MACEAFYRVLAALAEPWRECFMLTLFELLYEYECEWEWECWEVITPALKLEAAVLLIGLCVVDVACLLTW